LQRAHSWNAQCHESFDCVRCDAGKIIISFRKFPSPTAAFLLFEARFALMSAQVFSRTDLSIDSECFYNSILELLDDPDETDEVKQLLHWWNR
jgi:hypothetical protein